MLRQEKLVTRQLLRFRGGRNRPNLSCEIPFAIFRRVIAKELYLVFLRICY
jgi:hypothetical protein